MKITVTREEIREAKQLLQLLESWEQLSLATHQYRGFLELKHGAEKFTMPLEPQGNGLKKGYDKVLRKINGIARRHADSMCAEVIELIRESMPLPLEK